MCDAPTISPYLRRPLRSYDQVLREQAGKERATARSSSSGGETAKMDGLTTPPQQD